MVILSPLHRLVTGFVRRTWLVTLVTVLACAGFTARAVAAFTAVDAVVLPAPIVARAVPAPKPRLQPDGAVLVERNIFCSTCVPGDGPGVSNAYAGQPAVLIAINAGASPLATVRVIPTEIQGSWAIGEVIPGVGRVDRIGNSMIEVIDEAGHRGQLTLALPIAAAPARAGAATPGPGPAADPFAGRVTKLAEGSYPKGTGSPGGSLAYEVDRELVRELVGGGGKPTGVRARPELEHGKVKGLRLLGAGPSSVAGAIGLKSGDILTAIDGKPIKTLDQLLDLYSRLDQMSAIELQGTRGGKPLSVALKFR
ncbi:MAG: PDZ domain-containing protein [Kofleriaceae bacterium]